MPDNKFCKKCRQQIDANAAICHHCNYEQSIMAMIFSIKFWVQFLPAIVSIPMLYTAYTQTDLAKSQVKIADSQLILSKGENVKAQEASKVAQEAADLATSSLKKADEVAIKSSNILTDVNNIYGRLRKVDYESKSNLDFNRQQLNRKISRTYIILLDKKGKLIKSLRYNNEYSNIFYSSILFNENVALNSTVNIDKELLFDLFELSLMDWYNQTHFGGWYSSVGAADSAIALKLGYTVIKDAELLKVLSHNKAIPLFHNNIGHIRLYLPPETKLTVNSIREASTYITNMFRYGSDFIIENKYMIIDVNIRSYFEYNIDTNIDAINVGLHNNILPGDDLKAIKVNVNAKLTVKDNFELNEDTAIQHKWASQLISNLDKTFDNDFLFVKY